MNGRGLAEGTKERRWTEELLALGVGMSTAGGVGG